MRIKQVIDDKKICNECKEIFYSEDWGQIYCSVDCRKNVNRRRSNRLSKEKSNWIPKTLLCVSCQSKFNQKTHNQRFCSRECSKDYYKKLSNFEIVEDISPNYQAFFKVRFEILKRDNFQCKYCGRSPKTDNCKLHVDHIIPKSKGGTDNPRNLITSCLECNLGKKDVLLEERQLKNGIQNGN